MYTYLVQKYGLKSLIVEWATAIINSIKFYINSTHEQAFEQDATIQVFAKILKNQVEEQYHLQQLRFELQVKQVLKEALREKYPLKSEPEIQKHQTRLIQGKQRLDEQLSQKLVARIYPHGCSEVTS